MSLYLNGMPLNVTMFPDNTSQVWKLPDDLLYEGSQIHIKWIFQNEGEFLQLAQLKLLLDDYSTDAVLEITYLPYGRQDKHITNTTTFALRSFATLLNSLKFDKIIIHDPHSEIALELISNSLAAYPVGEVYTIIENNHIDVLCYPDKGAVEKYTKIFEYHDHIYGKKVRDQLTGNITSYKVIGDPAGKDVLIVDDICDGGMTFKLLAKDLLAAGAKSVSLFVTHGIFSKGVRTLFDSGIGRVFTKDGEVGKRHDSIQF